MHEEGIDVANFFWHGSPLGAVEWACISSFLKNQFIVNIYSYNNLSIPSGANLLDASDILPAEDLLKYVQDGQHANLPAFSDAFRYALLKLKGGWWFDVDVFCLAPVEAYVNLISQKDIKISLAHEDSSYINGAVLYIQDSIMINKVIEELHSSGTVLNWGDIGPKLLTRVIKELGYEKSVDPTDLFYPIHYNDYSRIFDPASLEWCLSRTKTSLAVHLWSEIGRRRKSYSIDMLNKGAYLDYLVNLSSRLSN